MRVRRLIVATLLASAALVVSAGAAHAAPDPKADKATKECVKILNDGGKLDDCHQSPSVLKPDNSELVWGSISFLILLGLFFKWGYPAVVKSMKAREDRIKDDLEGAEGAKTEAETVLSEYRAQLADARTEAGRIIDEARQAADQVRRDLIARAEADAADLRTRAQEDIRLAGERAMADLRSRVSDLAIELAEKVVERNLDRDTQLALIDNYINSVGSN
ncbi:MAG: F-type H+-transporting ATPase subunit b [Actinomycetota bacterium]|jgi:F-type H+-transporting ATPase subunit b|nr:F-type H+-transporting ATPase subunit b [Actinomycetota bacterium]